MSVIKSMSRFCLYSSLASCMFLSVSSYADEFGLETAIGYDFLVAGDYQATYNGLMGADVRYYLFDTGDWQHFIKGGYRQADDNPGSSLSMFDIGFGSSVPVANFWNRDLSFDYSIGAAHLSEDFAVQLIDRLAENSFTETTFMVTTGLKYRLFDDVHARLVLSQVGSNATSVGLQFSYIF